MANKVIYRVFIPRFNSLPQNIRNKQKRLESSFEVYVLGHVACSYAVSDINGGGVHVAVLSKMPKAKNLDSTWRTAHMFLSKYFKNQAAM